MLRWVPQGERGGSALRAAYAAGDALAYLPPAAGGHGPSAGLPAAASIAPAPHAGGGGLVTYERDVDDDWSRREDSGEEEDGEEEDAALLRFLDHASMHVIN